MELRDYLRILRKNWTLIAALALLGVAAAAAVSIAATPKYSSTAELYVSVRSSAEAGTTDLVQGTSFARQAVTSYVSIVNSVSVLEPVIEDLGLDLTAQQLAGRVSATSPLNTVLIDVAVTGDDPQEAAAIANGVAESFIDFVVNTLEKPAGDGPSTVNLSLVQPAQASAAPISPNVPTNLALGLFIGLAVGVSLAVLRTVLDTRVHSTHDIETVTEKPILGGITFDPDAKKRPLVVHVDPRSPRAESFRTFRTNLQFLNVEDSPRSIVITSSVPGEGKSTTAANIAISLAETGMRVALVDGDLRLPRVADYMGIEGAVGLTDVLIGRAELDDVMQKWGRGQLYVLPSGRIPPNPSEILGSTRMSALLKTLDTEFDYVVIDAPPLLLVTDAAVLSKLAGGAILVVAAGRTKKTEIAGAVRALDHIGSRFLGVVATMLPTKGPDAYGYGTYGYGDSHVFDEAGTATAKRSKFGRAK